MGTPLIQGRDDELTHIDAVLGMGGDRRGALISGTPGIGRSVVWAAAAARVTSTLLTTSPVEAERHLAYSGLNDLLVSVDPGLLDTLPPPQARALQVATLRADPRGTPPGERAVAFALVALVRSMASVRPLVIAIDDVHWLDHPTGSALSYLVRRTSAYPVRFLFSVADAGSSPVLDAFGRDELARVPLGPIGLGALHRIVLTRTGAELSRPELLLLHSRSGGNPARAVELATPGDVTPPPVVVRSHPPSSDARALLEAEAAADGPAAGPAHAQLAMLWISYDGDVTRALGHARRAVELLDCDRGDSSGEDRDNGGDADADRADTACPVELLTALAVLENFAGPASMAGLDRALDLATTRPVVSTYEHPLVWKAHRLMLEDRLDEARGQFASALELAAASGDEWSRAAIMFHLTEVECRSGNWTTAAAHAHVCRTLTDQAAHGQPGLARYAEGMVEVRLGNVARTRQLADEGERLAEAHHDELYRILNVGLAAHACISVGDMAEAARRLHTLPAHLIALGWREPSVFPLWPDAIESLVSVGNYEIAARYQAVFEANALAYKRPTAMATATRCAGLLQAAGGDVAGALDTLADAVTLHERSPDRYELGRTLLVLGATRRRARMKRAAREALTASLGIFEELGSPHWAERVRAEVARIGGRVSSSHLTRTEERVAALAVRGATNREIAAELFVTGKTVEVHLSRIYRKVGVRSRVELAHRFRNGKS